MHLTAGEYENHVLQPQYCTKIVIERPLTSLEKTETVVDDDGNTFEILLIPQDFEQKLANDNEIEEFELLEVDHVGANSENTDNKSNEQSQNKESTSMDLNDTENLQTTKTFQTRSRSKQKTNLQTTRKSARQMAKTQKPVQNSKINKTISISIKTEKQNKFIGKESINESSGIAPMQQDCDDIAEGESDNEFPARDSDNEDWPSQETLDGFPKTMVKGGLLLVKGKELMSMICR